jgi:hypothetical protein
MATVQQAVTAAVEWEAKAPGNSWDVFDYVDGDTEADCYVRDMAKLLACRIDRGAPESMIDSQAHLLAALVNPETAEAEAAAAPRQEGPSLLTQCVVGAAAGYAVGRMMRGGGHGHGSHLGRALTNAAIYSVARPAFAGLFKQAAR